MKYIIGKKENETNYVFVRNIETDNVGFTPSMLECISSEDKVQVTNLCEFINKSTPHNCKVMSLSIEIKEC